MAQTDRQTDEHGNSMTNSAQWGRVGENGLMHAESPFKKSLFRMVWDPVVKPTIQRTTLRLIFSLSKTPMESVLEEEIYLYFYSHTFLGYITNV